MGSLQQSGRHLRRREQQGSGGRRSFRRQLLSVGPGSGQQRGIRGNGRSLLAGAARDHGAAEYGLPLRALGYSGAAQGHPCRLSGSVQSGAAFVFPVEPLRHRFHFRRVGLCGARHVQYRVRRGDRGGVPDACRARVRPGACAFPRMDVRRGPLVPEGARAQARHGLYDARDHARPVDGGVRVRHLQADEPDQPQNGSRGLQHHRQMLDGNGVGAGSRLLYHGEPHHGGRGHGLSGALPGRGDAQRPRHAGHPRLQRRTGRSGRGAGQTPWRGGTPPAARACAGYPDLHHFRAV